MKIRFFLLLLNVAIICQAQKLYTYADKEKTYTYYLDSAGNKVGHGNYVNCYSSKFSEGCTYGHYKKGYRDGKWSATNTLKNERFYNDPNILITGTNSAIFEYDNGIPHGTWAFEANNKMAYYKFNYRTNKKEIDHYSVEHYKLSFQFNHNNITGYFHFIDHAYDNKIVTPSLLKKTAFPEILILNSIIKAQGVCDVHGRFSDKGQAIGQWFFDKNNTMVEFQNGVLITQRIKTIAEPQKWIEIDNDADLLHMRKQYSTGLISQEQLLSSGYNIEYINLFSNSSFSNFDAFGQKGDASYPTDAYDANDYDNMDILNKICTRNYGQFIYITKK
ncbi:MAG: hypothetical protein H6Q17_23 [Bacteroidetes bacterium]|nr:hypothetical protein [Bacteroidota bacterium]